MIMERNGPSKSQSRPRDESLRPGCDAAFAIRAENEQTLCGNRTRWIARVEARPNFAGMRFPRVHRRVRPNPSQPIEIQILGNGFIEVLKARDISVGGIGIHVPHAFAGCDIDSELEILVKLHGSKPFLTRARVRNQAQAAGSSFFGVEFTQLSRGDQERIERYVSQRAAEGASV